MLKSLKKLNQEDNVLNRIQDNIAASIDEIIKCPLLDGILLKSVTLISGDNEVEHKLARPVQGYLIVRKNNDAVIYDKEHKLASKYLTLNTDNDTIVNIYIF